MAIKKDAQATWLPVIGKCLAFLCMKAAEKERKFKTILHKVKFLQGLGLTRDDAAHAAGSSAASVQVMYSQARGKKAKHGGAKKKTSR